MSKNGKRTVIITGAGQGIGQAIAFRFAADGSNIVIASKDSPAQIQETIEGIQSAGGKALGLEVNSLWPQTNIATQRLKDHLSPKVYAGSRWPSVMADAAYELARRTVQEATGQFLSMKLYCENRESETFLATQLIRHSH